MTQSLLQTKHDTKPKQTSQPINKLEKQYQTINKWHSPCRPTISATCSELGTGTHSVVFWLFFPVLESVSKDKGSFESLESPSIDNSRANWRALWSSRDPPTPPILPPERWWWWWLLLNWAVESLLSWKRLAGITRDNCSHEVMIKLSQTRLEETTQSRIRGCF